LEEKERREAEARAAREEEERREAEERAAREAREKEEREKERMRLEEARAQREARERAEKERAEQERLRKTQEEEEARAKEAERQRKAEEDVLKAAETSENAHALPDDAEPTSSLPEEGEVEDEVSQSATAATEEPSSANKSAAAPQPQPSPPPVPHISAELPTKPLEKEILRIDTSLPPSPEHPRKRPGPLNLTTTINNANITPSLPSALAAARHIEDISCITYPQGIRSPKLELNVNTQKGKFRYVFEIYVICAFVSQQVSFVAMIAISYCSL
jgi:translation initiation factor 4G